MKPKFIPKVEDFKSYNLSLIERGFNKGSFRVLRPFQCSCLSFTDRIIIGLIVDGKLEVQTALGIHEFFQKDEFMLPANLHFQVASGVEGATIFFAKQKLKSISYHFFQAN